MSEHLETQERDEIVTDDPAIIDLTDDPADIVDAVDTVEPGKAAPAAPATAFAPNPMAIDTEQVAAAAHDSTEIIDLTDDSASALNEAPIDAFDADHHKGILDRLEHELALVDAALSHIDEDEMDAAETAIKELARHNDDGQVALPLR